MEYIVKFYWGNKEVVEIRENVKADELSKIPLEKEQRGCSEVEVYRLVAKY